MIFYKYYKMKLLDFYYNLIWSIRNFFTYFRIVSKMRPWDYIYILEMMKFQLEKLCNQIEVYGQEINEDKLPKIAKIKRVIELLNNKIEDNYAQRSGYILEAEKFVFKNIKDSNINELLIELQPGYENYDGKKVFKDAQKLEETEWKELFDLLYANLQEWWD